MLQVQSNEIMSINDNSNGIMNINEQSNEIMKSNEATSSKKWHCTHNHVISAININTSNNANIIHRVKLLLQNFPANHFLLSLKLISLHTFIINNRTK